MAPLKSAFPPEGIYPSNEVEHGDISKQVEDFISEIDNDTVFPIKRRFFLGHKSYFLIRNIQWVVITNLRLAA